MNHPNAKDNSEVMGKRVVRSEDLFQGGREVIIEHENDHYRLLVTKSGKLILNK